MAIAVPHQPRYQRRGPYIYYLLGERMVIRTRPARVRDPRTPAQRRQRLRMRVASTFLKGFQPIVSRGFEPQLQENFRKVGAYQQALGHLMQHALRDEKGGVTLDTARVQLAQGRPSPLGAVRATVRGGLLRLAWSGALPPKTAGVLLGGIEFVHKNIELLAVIIVLVSVVAVAIEYIRGRKKEQKALSE